MSKILIVDDDSAFREALSMVLNNADYSITQAVDGKDALKKLEQNGTFDLIIVDILMPEMDGMEFINMVKKKNSSIKIIAITGGGRIDSSDLYLEFPKALGSDSILKKLFTTEQVLALINKVLK